MILPGRAVTMDAKMAEKYLKAYPQDLIEFDSLVVGGGKKNLNRENTRLESKVEELEALFVEAEKAFWMLAGENETLSKTNDQFKSDNLELNDSNVILKDENQGHKDKISELEKELEEATKPEDKKTEPEKPTADPEVKTEVQEKSNKKKKD